MEKKNEIEKIYRELEYVDNEESRILIHFCLTFMGELIKEPDEVKELSKMIDELQRKIASEEEPTEEDLNKVVLISMGYIYGIIDTFKINKEFMDHIKTEHKRKIEKMSTQMEIAKALNSYNIMLNLERDKKNEE